MPRSERQDGGRNPSKLVEVSTEELANKDKRKFPLRGPFWQRFDRDSIFSQIKHKDVVTQSVAEPKQVVNPKVVVSSVTVGGKNYSQQDVRFTQPSDPNFAGAYVWIKGYNRGTSSLSAKLPWVKAADVHESPSSFLLDRTTENIIIGVQSYNKDGSVAKFEDIPTVTVTLI